MIVTNLNHNNWGLEALMTRTEKEFRSTGTCSLLRDKRVGGGVTIGAKYKLAGFREGTN